MPRNLSGVYTLPAGNPVVPGTTIDAAWANSTLEDISNELTNSLSRTGAGGMLAPFRIADGNVTGPGLSFLNETNTGYYRVGAGSTAFSILGVNTLQMNTTSVTVPAARTLNAQGNALVAGTLGVTGATLMASTLGVTGVITALGGVLGNITAASGTSTFNDLVINGSLDMVAGSSATITGLSTPTNASDAANKGYVDTQDALKLNLAGGTMSGNLAMGNNLVTGLGTPASGGDATNKTYVDGQIATRLALAGGTMSGAIAMGTNKITGLGTPTADADAATKAYVDSVAQGLDVKGSVRAATTGNITLSGTQTIDGVAVIAGDRVLVKDQSTAANNGIYVAAAGSWSRAADADTWAELVGAFVFVEDGTVNDNSGWVCTVAPGGTLGVTAVTFEQFSGAGQITAGAGMVKVGNTLNVQSASSSRIVVGADEIDLATTGVSAGTYRSVGVDIYGRVTTGTNPTTLAGYGITDAYTSTATDTLLNGKLSLTGGTMSGPIAMGTSKITGLGDPTNAQDAATKNYTDTGLNAKLSLSGGTMTGALAMGTNRITGMGDPVNAQDGATKNYIDTIFGSTASAAASAAAAASSASSASSSASSASTSASNASTSASTASTALFNFRAQYLGPLASDPTVDGNGNPVSTGDLYFNTTASETRVYNGSAWVAAYVPTAGYALLASANVFTANQTITANTSNDALKITQTGSGNALYIEDVAADATPFVVSSTGVLGIGTTTPDNVTSAGIALVSNSGFYPQLIQRNTANDANASYLGLEKIRGSSAVQSNDILGNIVFRGYDGTQFLQGAAIWARISATPGANDMPTDLLFGTTPDGGAGISERMNLDKNGNLGLGVTPSAWQSGLRAFQVGATASIYSNGSNTTFHGLNFFTDSGGTNRYLISNFASAYGQVSGAHNWFTAPSGTAGNAISFTQAMTLEASGRLLVGVTSGSYALDVGDVSGGNMFRFARSGVELSSYISSGTPFFGTTSNTELALMTNSTRRATIDTSGNLGLGVTPSAWGSSYRALQVGSASSLYGIGANTIVGNNAYNDGTNSRYITSSQATLYAQNSSGQHIWYTAASGTAGNAISFTQAMTLDASGNLGVNATSIAGLGTNITTIEIKGKATDRTGGVRLRSSDNSVDFSYYSASGVGSLGSDSNHPLAFVTYATERARITSGGLLLIGKTSDVNGRLQVRGSYSSGILVDGGTDDGNWGGGVGFYSATSNGQYGRVHASTGGLFATGGTTGGVVLSPGATSWASASDVRLKNIIEPIASPLDKVMRLESFIFSWKSDASNKRCVGLSAQSVDEVLPEAVVKTRNQENREDETEYLGVKYTELVPLLTAAIQELKAQNDDLRARVAQLEAKGA
jgi:hypothetical protein